MKKSNKFSPEVCERAVRIAQGNANLAYWCRLLPVPVLAIAGMDAARAADAADAAPCGAAAIGAVTTATDPATGIDQLQEAIADGRNRPAFPVPPQPQPQLP